MNKSLFVTALLACGTSATKINSSVEMQTAAHTQSFASKDGCEPGLAGSLASLAVCPGRLAGCPGLAGCLAGSPDKPGGVAGLAWLAATWLARCSTGPS